PPPASPLLPYTTLFRSGRRSRSEVDPSPVTRRRAPRVGRKDDRRSTRPNSLKSTRIAVADVERCVRVELHRHSRLNRQHRRGRVHLNKDVTRHDVRQADALPGDRKSTRLNFSHVEISYAVVCWKKKNNHQR